MSLLNETSALLTYIFSENRLNKKFIIPDTTLVWRRSLHQDMRLSKNVLSAENQFWRGLGYANCAENGINSFTALLYNETGSFDKQIVSKWDAEQFGVSSGSNLFDTRPTIFPRLREFDKTFWSRRRQNIVQNLPCVEEI